MKHKHKLIVTGAAVLAAALISGGASAPRTNDAEFAPMVMPLGITLQPLGIAQGYALSKPTATKLPRNEIVFADAKGMTLYTYDKDQPGKPACVDECTKTWIPALAIKGAKPVARWSIVTRPDGTQQWAWRNKPLYTYTGDIDIGSVYGNSPKRFARGPLIGLRGAQSRSIPKDVPLPADWHAAMMYPVEGVDLPSGIMIRDIEDAMALALIDERTEKTLYAFDGDPKKAEKTCATNACRNLWIPFTAPRLAQGKGDFGIAQRDDGVTQWTYKGRALFTNANDLVYNDANGMGVDKMFQVAAYGRYYLPENITLQETHKLGKVLASAKGQTLYRRNSYIYQSGGGHGMRRGDTVRPQVGRDLGNNPRCEIECEKWHAFLAPVGAQPSADFGLIDAPDGVNKQWTSRGYALWTYDGDTRPGDINGNDAYELKQPPDANTVLDIGTIYDGAWALFWIAAFP